MDLRSKNLYKKHIISIISAYCISMYQCFLRCDNFGGINKLKLKVQEKVSNRIKKPKKVDLSDNQNRYENDEALDDSKYEEVDTSILINLAAAKEPRFLIFSFCYW